MTPAATRASLLLLMAALVLPGCQAFKREPPQDPPAELTRFDASLQVRRAWSADVGKGAERLRLGLVPASDGSVIYAASHDGQVSAWDAERGRRIWRVRTRLPLAAGPAVQGGLVAVGSSKGDLLALDAADGSRLWQVQLTGEVLAPPALSGNAVIARTVDGKLTALERDSGRQLWFVQQSVPRLSVRGTGAPVVAGNLVLGGFDNGRVAAYELADGNPAWEALLTPPAGRNEVERLVDISATPRVAGDDVYVAGYQGRVAALALESGQALWTRDVPSYAGIGVDLNNVYVSSSRSEIIAFTRRGGRELWRQDMLLNRSITGPVPYGSSVVVGDFEGYLHWFDAETGELKARVRAGKDRLTAMPLVVNDRLFVLTEGGKLYAFRAVN